MLFAWLKCRRRRKMLARPFPVEWLDYLVRNVRHYQYLAQSKQAILRQIVQVFVAEKEWIGCEGLRVSDEMKVTVAGQASLLILGLSEPFYYDGVPSVTVHPHSFVHSRPFWRRGHAAVQDSLVGGCASRSGPICALLGRCSGERSGQCWRL